MRVRAEILTVGDELCRGEITNTNSQHIAEHLTVLGFAVEWMTSTTDAPELIEDALRRAASRAHIVIVSGGLGPTEDDRTVDVVAAMLGVEAEMDPEALAKMERRFAKSGFALTPNNLRQVRIPRGAEVLVNSAGMAPGFLVHIGEAECFFMPGVPREMEAILREGILPRLREAHGRAGYASEVLRVFGLGESHVDHRLFGLVAGMPDVTLHYRLAFPEILVRLVVRDASENVARARLEGLVAEARERLGDACYAAGVTSLAATLGAELRALEASVGIAESCTGGLATQVLSTAPGASDYLRLGIVAYANAMKTSFLGVSEELLATHGAVSREVALAMAHGIRAKSGATFGVGITGIAGPGGGSPEKPVGTLHFAVTSASLEHHEHRVLLGDRERVQRTAAFAALGLLRQVLRAKTLHEREPS